MGKTGPTPRDGGDTRRRVAAPAAEPQGVTLPAPQESWRTETKGAWYAYENSEASHILRAEDVPAVLRLFDRIDKLNSMWQLVPDEPEDAEKALRTIRILDAMIARGLAELGIGPLARARLGIGAAPKTRSALDDFMSGNGADD